jgi:hypothetical protein
VTPNGQKKLLIPFFIENFDDPVFYRANLPTSVQFSPSILSMMLHPPPNPKYHPTDNKQKIAIPLFETPKFLEEMRSGRNRFSISQNLKFNLGSIILFVLSNKHVYVDGTSGLTTNEEYFKKCTKVKDYVKRLTGLCKDIKKIYGTEIGDNIYNLLHSNKKDCSL